jgi:hypothetical protein
MPLVADSPHSDIAKPKRLLDHLREKLRLRNHSYETDKTCISWAWGYILFHDERRAARPGALVPPRRVPFARPPCRKRLAQGRPLTAWVCTIEVATYHSW